MYSKLNTSMYRINRKNVRSFEVWIFVIVLYSVRNNKIVLVSFFVVFFSSIMLSNTTRNFAQRSFHQIQRRRPKRVFQTNRCAKRTIFITRFLILPFYSAFDSNILLWYNIIFFIFLCFLRPHAIRTPPSVTILCQHMPVRGLPNGLFPLGLSCCRTVFIGASGFLHSSAAQSNLFFLFISFTVSGT